MRFIAPAREAVDSCVFARPPLALWREFGEWLQGIAWPSVDELNRCLVVSGDDFSSGTADSGNQSGFFAGRGERVRSRPHFVPQTPALLADGLHYEQRIAERGEIATRAGNWHDLLNALVWLRYPALKSALNLRQVAEIAVAGPKRRTRAQCALTHFDEAGVVVIVRDISLLALWDAHDWHGLFWREREAWNEGRIAAHVFGHALLEHALRPAQLLVGKALVVVAHESGTTSADEDFVATRAFGACATGIRLGELLNDPQELRPLPLSGIPGWHPENSAEHFYLEAPCFRALRAGRQYPGGLRLSA